ncbi:MAG: pre-peptidase C-terminal domain-containing protein [Rhizonema sp. PD37]|nr:pre-peptidase C-terminal domain-containing protein [Rhizonema sp. PD37]
MSATASPSTTLRDPGNSLNTALDIGILRGVSNYKDFVGSTDRDDYYRFTLTQTSNFKLSLTGLTDYADADLIYDNNGNGQIDYGETLGRTDGSQYSDGSINQTLGAGTYFIHVYTDYSSQNTNYTLSLSA